MEHNAELRDFLRTRRARLSVDDVEIGGTGRTRRVPGLAPRGGRTARGGERGLLQPPGAGPPSQRVRRGRSTLSPAPCASTTPSARTSSGSPRRIPRRVRRRAPAPVQRVRPGIRRILETLDDVTPAFVFGRRMDVLAANRLARALMTDFDALPPRERNLLRYTFLDESTRELFVDWDDVAPRQRRDPAPRRRAASRRSPAVELVGELSVKSPEFRRWWADHNVRERTPRHQALPPPAGRRSDGRIRIRRAARRSRPDTVHLHRRGGFAVGDGTAAAGQLDRRAGQRGSMSLRRRCAG